MPDYDYERSDFLYNNTNNFKSEAFEEPRADDVINVSYLNFTPINIPVVYARLSEPETDFCTSRAHIYLNVTCEMPIHYALVMYGYIAPFLLVVKAVANTLIVLVLSRPHMRTPTNVILMSIALCDVLTTLFPAPWNFYMYTLGNHYKPLGPVAACTAWKYMTQAIPKLFHTASIWMTLALAIQQYICVCHAPVARTWCTMARVVKCLVCIVIAASLYVLPEFLHTRFVWYITVWRGHFEEVCRSELAPWMHNISISGYFITRFGFTLLFVHLIPCTSLVVLNTLLIRAMRTAQLNRQKLFKENRKSELKSLRDSINTTWMLIVVVTVFLIAALPAAVVIVLHVISITIVDFLDYDFVSKLIFFSNFYISFFFPVNFAIYSAMSRQFRETFMGFFKKSASTITVESTKITDVTA